MTRFAAWFTPIIILACLGIVVIPIAAGANDRNRWINLSLQILVTACPCALVLSTPVTVVAGLAASARQGVLIKV
jgi:Cd2+/Zn2+-exporting ATPase